MYAQAELAVHPKALKVTLTENSWRGSEKNDHWNLRFVSMWVLQLRDTRCVSAIVSTSAMWLIEVFAAFCY